MGASRALYRTRQVWHALRPRIAAEDYSLVAELLNDRAAALFRAMEPRDQRHAFEVAHRLLDAGATEPDLLRAALLHDCGKGSVPVWLRIAKVLSPGIVRAVGAPDATGWRGAAYRLTDHAGLGAAAAVEAGLSERVARLIGGRAQDEDDRQLLAALIRADDAS